MRKIQVCVCVFAFQNTFDYDLWSIEQALET